MKLPALTLLLGLTVAAAGCSDSSQPTNVGEGANATAIADYEAQIKAEQDAANAAEKAAAAKPPTP